MTSFATSLSLRLLFSLGRVVRRVPRRHQKSLVRLLLPLAEPRLVRQRAALRSNLEVALASSSSPLDADPLSRQVFLHYGLYLVDLFSLPFLTGSDGRALLGEIRGREWFERARARGRGILLVGPHVGAWEIAGPLLGDLGCPVHAVSIRDPYPHFEKFRAQFRDREGLRMIWLSEERGAEAILEMREALERNEAVFLLGDRRYGGRAYTAPFFGRMVEFPEGPLHLAALTGAPLLPMVVVREGTRYVLECSPPIEVGGTREQVVEAGRELARSFERQVRRHPEQWYNFHPVFEAGGLSRFHW